jgi:hypothetical protein
MAAAAGSIVKAIIIGVIRAEVKSLRKRRRVEDEDGCQSFGLSRADDVL